MQNMKQQIKNDIDTFRLNRYLEKLCKNLPVDADEVREKLLSPTNIKDIMSGQIPARTIRAHIEIWCKENKQKVN